MFASLLNLSRYFDYTKKTLSILEKSSLCSENLAKKSFLMVVENWGWTTSPFFQLILGELLKLDGYRVVYLLDDIPYGKSKIAARFRIHCLKKLLKENVFLLLSTQPKCIEQKDEQNLIERCVTMNMIHDSKGEFHIKERERERVKKQLKTAFERLQNINFNKYDKVIIPGGICQDTYMLVKMCREKGVPYTTYDCGFRGVLMLANNAVAAHLGELPESLSLFFDRFSDDIRWEQFARGEFIKRKEGRDMLHFQTMSTTVKDDLSLSNTGQMKRDYYLLMMNSVWDSAAVGIHTIYESYKDWVLESVDWIMKNTNDSIIVRQHPGDRFPIQRGNDDYKSLFNQKYEGNDRVHFIAAEEKINSYDLIESSLGVLVFSSTVGIESVLLGKPVICLSNCYYSNFKFIKKPKTKGEYYSYLSMVRKMKISANDKKSALALWFLTQCCNSMCTPFTPSNNDFAGYSAYTLKEIKSLHNVDITLKSIEESIPISFLVAEKILCSGQPLEGFNNSFDYWDTKSKIREWN